MYGGFFEVLAAALTFAFFVGEVPNPHHHEGLLLDAATFTCLIAVFTQVQGDRSVSALRLASAIVAAVQLVAAAVVWNLGTHAYAVSSAPNHVAIAVSLSAGALLATIICLLLLMLDCAQRDS